MEIRKNFAKIHFIALAIAVVNTIIQNTTSYGLYKNFEYAFEIFVLISGLILFFLYLRPFKILNFYFSFYVVVLLLFISLYLSKSILIGIILMFISYPFIPDTKVYEKDGVIISIPFKGFMGRCCTYEIKERKLLIFEKSYEVFELEHSINFKDIEVISTEDKIEFSYLNPYDNEMLKKVIRK